ncbi:MAG: cell wall hydrolase [Caulobacter sp.]|nr:cell wall hydrolase [Caulobacter sp.]
MSLASRRHYVLAVVGLLIVGGLVAGWALVGLGVFAAKPDVASQKWGAAVGRRILRLSDAGLARYAAHELDPAAQALARRHDPRRHQDYWGRPPGWERLDLKRIPRLGDSEPDFEDARLINSFRRPAPLPIEPAKPFVLRGAAVERERALHCMTQAVYFEAGYEPLAGQQAVAQTVLNRLRHPGYPKSVCGVIYEGSARATGCQFSFACDGSMDRPLNPTIWAQAQAVARRALGGFVMKDVGVATHYHADYVAPYWAPTLVKLRQIGAHIFYRWTGPSGTLKAFTGRYSGQETLTAAILLSADPRTLEAAPPEMAAAGAAIAPPPPRTARIVGADGTIEILPPLVSGGGPLALGGRRAPTPEEIAKINKLLEALPDANAPVVIAAPAAAPPPPPPPPKKPAQRPPSLLTPLN